MKSWIGIAVGAAALIGLVLLVRWQAAPVTDEAASGAPGAMTRSRDAARPGGLEASDSRRAGFGGTRSGADGSVSGGSASKRPAASGAGGGESASARTLAEVVRNARSAGGDDASAVEEAGGALPADGVRVQPGTVDAGALPHERHDGQGGETADGEVVENAPEAVPDVVYEGGPEHTFGTETQVEVPDAGKISGEAGTISFWLNPQWPGGDTSDATFVQLGDTGMRLVKNVDYLRFEYVDAAGAEKGLGLNIGGWSEGGDWHQVTGTWGNGNWALYVDGKLVSQQAYTNAPPFPTDTRLYVGSNYAEGVPIAPGDVSSLTVLNRIASAGDVAQTYQAGAPHPR